MEKIIDFRKMKKVTLSNKILYIIAFLLIINVYVFNDIKQILYVTKVIYILVVGVITIKNQVRIKYPFVWMVFLFAYALSSYYWSYSREQFVYNYVWMTHAIFIMIITALNFNTEKNRIFLMNVIVFASIVLAIRLLVQTPLHTLGINRLGWYSNYNPNVVGMQMSFAAIISFAFLTKNRSKYLYLPLLSLFVIFVLLSGSRKSLIGLVIALVIYSLIMYVRQFRVKNFFKIFFFLLLLFMIFSYVSQIDMFTFIFIRMETLYLAFVGEGDNVRFSMINIGISLFNDKPLFGYGLGGYSYISGFNTYSHNNYIEFLVNFGLGGFIIYYSLYAIILLKLFKKVVSKNINPFYLSVFLMIMFLETGVVGFNSLFLLIPFSLVLSYISCSSDVHYTCRQNDNLMSRI